MGLVCLVCDDESGLELPFSPSHDSLHRSRVDGLDVPGAPSASGLASVHQTSAVTAPSHEAA
jgi:hypothetical protein